jgi:hypothetical protein
MTTDRSPLHPDPFAQAPFFCLLPDRVTSLSLESSRPALFARLEHILAMRSNGSGLDRDQEKNLILEEAMLRELLQFSETLAEQKRGTS